MNNAIQFTVIENGTTEIINTYVGSYRNLMFLLKETLCLDEFGECGGMGRCATCVVKTIGITGNSATKERNEPATLSKYGFENENIRLACQLNITKDLDGAIIELISE